MSCLERRKLAKLKRRSLSSLDLVVLGAIMNSVYSVVSNIIKISQEYLSTSLIRKISDLKVQSDKICTYTYIQNRILIQVLSTRLLFNCWHSRDRGHEKLYNIVKRPFQRIGRDWLGTRMAVRSSARYQLHSFFLRTNLVRTLRLRFG